MPFTRLSSALRVSAVCSAAAFFVFALSAARTVHADDDAARPEFFTARVKPILDANCARCHGGFNHRGGLNMDTRASLLKGGRDGAVVVPGDPAKSLLVRLIRHEGPADDPMDMPPNKPKISDADIQTVTAWVKAGAVMPQ
jgi:mono/diheme cytochrome c family protein